MQCKYEGREGGRDTTDRIAQNGIALKILQHAGGRYPDRVFRGDIVGLDEHGDSPRGLDVCNLMGELCRVSQLFRPA